MERVSTFYSPDVIFEGSLARCPWESGLDLGNGVHKPQPQPRVRRRPVPKIPSGIQPYHVSHITPAPETPSRPRRIPIVEGSSVWSEVGQSPPTDQESLIADEEDYNSSMRSSESSDASLPPTPSSARSAGFARVKLCEDGGFHSSLYDDIDLSSDSIPCTPATEGHCDDRFDSSVFLATPISERIEDFPMADYHHHYRGEGGPGAGSTGFGVNCSMGDNNPYLDDYARINQASTHVHGHARQTTRNHHRRPPVDLVIPPSPTYDKYTAPPPTTGRRNGLRTAGVRLTTDSQSRRPERVRAPSNGLFNSFFSLQRSGLGGGQQSWIDSCPSPPPPAPPPQRHQHHHGRDKSRHVGMQKYESPSHPLHPHDHATHYRISGDGQCRVPAGGGGSATQQHSSRPKRESNWFTGRLFRP